MKLIDGPFGATALIWASALHYFPGGNGTKAEQAGRIEEINFLLKHGARINDRDKYGATALMWAAASGHDENRITHLLNADADINAIDKYGNNALMYPILYGGWAQYKIMETLMERGINTKNRNIAGQSPIDLDQTIGTTIVQDHYWNKAKIEGEDIYDTSTLPQPDPPEKVSFDVSPYIGMV